MKQVIRYSLIGWVIVGMIFVIVVNSVSDPTVAITRSLSVVGFQGIMYFLNLLYLTPKLLEKGRRKEFVFGILSIVVVYTVGMGLFDLWVDQYLPLHPKPIGERSIAFVFLFRFITSIPPLVLSTLIIKTILLSQKNKESLELRNRMLEAETKALKAQINPHFLFNTLNNIYSLSQIKPEKTGPAIMNLSEILRYVTYDGNQNFVQLSAEIGQIENFIALQYLKDESHENIHVNINLPENSLQIAPLLLISFIENAFKHSNHEDKQHGWVKISLTLDGDWLHLTCANSYVPWHTRKDNTGGVGLENVKKRLHLLYPGCHELKITKGENEFLTDLKIKLAK
jgi:sensor histidine kinase YesM